MFHLPPAAYTLLQKFVFSSDQIDEIIGLLDLRPGEKVLELGCGTGLLAPHFLERGFEYWGIDPDQQRIKWAIESNPGGHFLVADALTFELEQIDGCTKVFIHNVLHHLSDEECRRLIDRVLALDPNIIFVATEPKRPTKWWHNPLGNFICNLDEGNFVRTLPEWQTLFSDQAKVLRIRRKFHWPVHSLHARLTR